MKEKGRFGVDMPHLGEKEALPGEEKKTLTREERERLLLGRVSSSPQFATAIVKRQNNLYKPCTILYILNKIIRNNYIVCLAMIGCTMFDMVKQVVEGKPYYCLNTIHSLSILSHLSSNMSFKYLLFYSEEFYFIFASPFFLGEIGAVEP